MTLKKGNTIVVAPFIKKVTLKKKVYLWRNEVFYKNLLQEKPISWCTMEKFPLKKLKVLQEYLIDTLETHATMELDTTTWYYINLRRVNQLLSPPGGNYFCTAKYVYHKIVYAQSKSKENIKIGRLYAKSSYSYMFLPREIRGYLINESEYLDFDMVNCHPTLLLEYSLREMNETPMLIHRYVTNRSSFLAEKAEKDTSSLSEAKTNILKCMNCDIAYAIRLGHLALEFFEEVDAIREHIYLHHYLDGSDLKNYVNNSFKQYTTIDNIKRSVQSLYLQTIETNYVFSLVLFLHEFVSKQLNHRHFEIEKKFKVFDRKVNADNTLYTLSCIPFFDGILAGSEISSVIPLISKGVELFNDTLSNNKDVYTRFVNKAIPKEMSKLNMCDLKMHESLLNYVDSLNTAQFNSLLLYLDIPALKFDSLKGVRFVEFDLTVPCLNDYSSFDALDTDDFYLKETNESDSKSDSENLDEYLRIVYSTREFRRLVYRKLSELIANNSDFELNEELLTKHLPNMFGKEKNVPSVIKTEYDNYSDLESD